MAIDNQVQILYSKILLQLFDELLVLGPVIGEPAGLPQTTDLLSHHSIHQTKASRSGLPKYPYP